MITKDPRQYYDGLLQASAALWERWIDLYGDRFERAFYNVRVGAGVRPPRGTSDAMRRDWWAVTALRIDAVAERENQTWVFEIAERPSRQMLSSLQLYTHILPLYQGQNATQRDVIRNRNAEDFLIPTDIRPIVIPALVCRFLGFDFRNVTEKAGILIFQFPGAGYPKLPATFLPSTQAASWFPGAP